ncbi:MAG TPA: cysteine hydrolase [Jatrophihabitans sp.]|jgi:nicotinamidase-related amidase|uniref:cysteine hydrolase family protein n=1 Tax=Jatrophihabitans sp. TaxID=1932789 RepID=UPI002F179278
MAVTPRILLVIDIQQEYTAAGRAFHIAGIEPSLTNAKTLIDAARVAGVPVWHVQHQQEKGVFARGGEHTDPIAGFEPQGDEPVFIKDMYNSFSSPELVKALEATKPEDITVIGYGTPLCCLSTIVDGMHRGYSFTLVEDAVAAKATKQTSEEEMHRSAVNVISEYARVTRTEDVLQEFKG